MAHHHKSNKAVEGNADSEHGRGMPRRPDEDAMAERVEEDRQDVGLPGDGRVPSSSEPGRSSSEPGRTSQ
ncbi:hypothetical protein [Streptomyces sp. NBC_01497]|uniref:hypothetical protein n=1 Tax=Streptomyces sp. NBC_01497 TaxID=2903885 RepID=UPI002E3193D2|nr:hypothetical protein [Streptomyces sp. NBC_01497]